MKLTEFEMMEIMTTLEGIFNNNGRITGIKKAIAYLNSKLSVGSV